MPNNIQATCFVVMGFGKKTDFETGRTLMKKFLQADYSGASSRDFFRSILPNYRRFGCK